REGGPGGARRKTEALHERLLQGGEPLHRRQPPSAGQPRDARKIPEGPRDGDRRGSGEDFGAAGHVPDEGSQPQVLSGFISMPGRASTFALFTDGGASSRTSLAFSRSLSRTGRMSMPQIFTSPSSRVM